MSRVDEVPVGGLRLLEGGVGRGRTGAEPSCPSGRGRDTGRSGPTVLQSGLAARDGERLGAVGRRRRGRSRFGRRGRDGGEPACLRLLVQARASQRRPAAAGAARLSVWRRSCCCAETSGSGSRSAATCGSSESAAPAGPSSSWPGVSSAAHSGWPRTATGRSRERRAESGRTRPTPGLSGCDLHLGDRAHGPRQTAAARVSASDNPSQGGTSTRGSLQNA